MTAVTMHHFSGLSAPFVRSKGTVSGGVFKRFGELKKSIGSVSQKVLTAQLRDMEDKGLVSRKVYAEVPPRVEYSLTELGKSLFPILDAMRVWGESYKAQSK